MILVRDARIEDADEMGQVHATAWQQSYTGIFPEAEINAHDAKMRARNWRRLLADPKDTVVLVAEDAGRVVGFGSAHGQRDAELRGMGYTGEISALYLLDAVKGRGAGRDLVRALTRRLIAQGHESMALWVLVKNARARGFYERMGGTYLMDRRDETIAELVVDAAYGWRDLTVPALGAISLDPASG